ncbi:hypothetical protein VNO78_34173 [Psophocarpus tetragonolobus]|uniref:Uncharacterized protein n=1 Tax=Psophocarpus tetragonolobus TaxID=3891 RepID=A0AAN9NZD2_PSOTE
MVQHSGLLQKYGKIDVIVSNAAANPSVDAILQHKKRSSTSYGRQMSKPRMPIEVWEDRDNIRKLYRACLAWHISLGLHSFNAEMPRKWVAMFPPYSYKGRLLTRASDYATTDIVHKILESWSLSVNLWTSRTASCSPDDWEGFLHYLRCLLEDGNIWCDEAVNDPIHLPKFGNCKV